MKLSMLVFSLSLISGLARASQSQIAYVGSDSIYLQECQGSLTLTNDQGFLAIDLEQVQNCTQFDILVNGQYQSDYLNHPMIHDYNGYSKTMKTRFLLGENNLQIIVHPQYQTGIRDIVTVMGYTPAPTPTYPPYDPNPNPGVPCNPLYQYCEDPSNPVQPIDPGNGSFRVIQSDRETNLLTPSEGGCGGLILVTRDYNSLYLDFVGVRECSRVDVISENNPNVLGRSDLFIQGSNGNRNSTLEVSLNRADFHYGEGDTFEITVRSESGLHQDRLQVYFPRM